MLHAGTRGPSPALLNVRALLWPMVTAGCCHLYLKRSFCLLLPQLGHPAGIVPSSAWQHGWLAGAGSPCECNGPCGHHSGWVASLLRLGGKYCLLCRRWRGRALVVSRAPALCATVVEAEKTLRWYCSSGTVNTGPEGLVSPGWNWEESQSSTPTAKKNTTPCASTPYPYWRYTTKKITKK